jgi:hypothetical protein
MRWRCLLPILMGLCGLAFAGERSLPEGGPSPASLQDLSFYAEDFAAAVQRGDLDLFRYWDVRPVSVRFQAPGQLELDWGHETESCRLEATRAGAGFDLLLDCGGALRRGRWIGLEPGRARLELAGERAWTLVALPESFEQIVAAAEARYAQQHLPALAGRYRDASGSELVLEADGPVWLDGSQQTARLLECLDLDAQPEDGPPPRIPCLHVQPGGDPDAGPVILGAAADGAGALVEGAVSEDAHPDGRPFERKQGGRLYTRVP